MTPPRRKWGQHWLASDRLADHLVRLIEPRTGDRFLEVGPGQGALTRPLLATGVQVVAVEIDPRCAHALSQLSEGGRLTVIHADILRHPDLPWFTGAFRMVGNLPYNVGSPILRTAARNPEVSDAHFMLQLEVADRVVAGPGTPDYGLLSVLIQWHFDGTIVLRLEPGSFHPPPRVHSAFVRLVRREPVGGAPIDDHTWGVLKASFGHRRKTLSKALRLGGWGSADVGTALESCEIDPRTRAERLAPADFARVASALPNRSL